MKDLFLLLLVFYVVYDIVNYHPELPKKVLQKAIEYIAVDESESISVEGSDYSNLAINSDLSPKYRKTNKIRDGSNVRYIVWCYNGVNQNTSYYKTMMMSAGKYSWHYIVEGDQVVNTIPVDQVATFYLKDNNVVTNGIGICLTDDYLTTINHAIKLKQYLSMMYPGAEHLTIQDIEGKEIPQTIKRITDD